MLRWLKKGNDRKKRFKKEALAKIWLRSQHDKKRFLKYIDNHLFKVKKESQFYDAIHQVKGS